MRVLDLAPLLSRFAGETQAHFLGAADAVGLAGALRVLSAASAWPSLRLLRTSGCVSLEPAALRTLRRHFLSRPGVPADAVFASDALAGPAARVARFEAWGADGDVEEDTEDEEGGGALPPEADLVPGERGQVLIQELLRDAARARVAWEALLLPTLAPPSSSAARSGPPGISRLRFARAHVDLNPTLTPRRPYFELVWVQPAALARDATIAAAPLLELLRAGRFFIARVLGALAAPPAVLTIDSPFARLGNLARFLGAAGLQLRGVAAVRINLPAACLCRDDLSELGPEGAELGLGEGTALDEANGAADLDGARASVSEEEARELLALWPQQGPPPRRLTLRCGGERGPSVGALAVLLASVEKLEISVAASARPAGAGARCDLCAWEAQLRSLAADLQHAAGLAYEDAAGVDGPYAEIRPRHIAVVLRYSMSPSPEEMPGGPQYDNLSPEVKATLGRDIEACELPASEREYLGEAPRTRAERQRLPPMHSRGGLVRRLRPLAALAAAALWPHSFKSGEAFAGVVDAVIPAGDPPRSGGYEVQCLKLVLSSGGGDPGQALDQVRAAAREAVAAVERDHHAPFGQ